MILEKNMSMNFEHFGTPPIAVVKRKEGKQ